MCAAAAATLLQSCLTLCDPIDGNPPGSPVPGILQERTLEWVAISLSNAWKWKPKVKLLSCVRLQQPHGLQPTRLLHPWDFPGKSTGVGCHCVCRTLKMWQRPSHNIKSEMLDINMTCHKITLMTRLRCMCAKLWRRRWHPTPVLLPGNSHGQRSLVGCSPLGHEESDTTEWLHIHFSLSCIGEGNGNPLQCSCLKGQWSLVGCCLWGCTVSDTADAT